MDQQFENMSEFEVHARNDILSTRSTLKTDLKPEKL